MNDDDAGAVEAGRDAGRGVVEMDGGRGVVEAGCEWSQVHALFCTNQLPSCCLRAQTRNGQPFSLWQKQRTVTLSSLRFDGLAG